MPLPLLPPIFRHAAICHAMITRYAMLLLRHDAMLASDDTLSDTIIRARVMRCYCRCVFRHTFADVTRALLNARVKSVMLQESEALRDMRC